MNRFASLLANSAAAMPATVQDFARREFTGALRHSNLKEWGPESDDRARIVLGVASYAPRELALLDEIDAILDQSPTPHRTVMVFDCANCASQADINRFLPGDSEAMRTPIAGFWKDGRLVQRLQGLTEVRDAVLASVRSPQTELARS